MPWDDIGDPVGVVRHPEGSEPTGLGVIRRARGLTLSRRLYGRREGRKESRKERRSMMKESVRNSWRGPAHSWWVVIGLVFLLTACTVEESDGPVVSDELWRPTPSEHGDWQSPRLGGPVWQANRGADAGSGHWQDPGRYALWGRSGSGLTRRRSSHPGGPGRGRTG